MPQESSLTGRSLLGTFSLLFVAIAVVFAVDTFLERTDRAEQRAEASRLFAGGRDLMRQGRSADAVERFKDAVSIERENRVYRLALAEGLSAAGKFADAEDSLTGLLQQDSTDGAANLAMARVYVKEGRPAEAASFYHRAIYGQWKDDASGNLAKVRFELIDLLARQGAKEELLAELLPLQDEAPNDVELRKRLGRLFIAAGSPAHAADVFRGVLRQRPRDADAYAGLGDAEFAAGNYQAAQANFVAASRLNPDDESIRARLDACNQVLDLDPTLRGLPSTERYRRTVKLVELALNEADQCPGNTSPLLEKARKAVTRPASGSPDAAEANLDLAEQLWQMRKKECPQPPNPKEPLALVLVKAAQ